MAGKAFATVELANAVIPTVAKWSGGGTQPKTRDTADSKVAGTTRKEPTGGREYEDIELEFTEREDEGLALDALHATMTTWRDELDQATRRKPLTLKFYKDRERTKLIGQLVVTGAWAFKVSEFEYEEASDDPRMFTASVTHLGSKYSTVAAT